MRCRMPVMDGTEATVEILKNAKATGSKLPVIIALTAHDLQDGREKCLMVRLTARK